MTALTGLIRRRILLNYRVDPGALAAMLPAPFRPKLQRGHGIAGVCLIRLEALRPRGLPSFLGFSSENAAHRAAVEWEEGGERREGVYVFRRDTGSSLARLAGGSLFPVVQNPARFDVAWDGERLDLSMASEDGAVRVRLKGRTAGALPAGSCFGSLEEASAFFAAGSLGFAPAPDGRGVRAIRLRTPVWKVDPFGVEEAASSWIEDPARFPPGSAALDHALCMRDIPSEWSAA